MARPTKADLEAENDELRQKIESVYEDLGEFLESTDDENADEEDEE